MSRSIKQRLISGGVWAFSGRVLLMVSGVLLNGLLARLLSPADMGVYFLILSLIVFFSQLAQLGMMRSVVYLISQSLGTNRPARARTAIMKIFLMVFLSACVVAGILASDIGRLLARDLFNSPHMAEHRVLIAAWLVTFALQSLMAETFRGFHDIPYATILDRLLTNIILVTVFALLWFRIGHSDLGRVLLLTISAYGSAVLFGGILLGKRVAKLEVAGETIGSKEILHISLPLLVASLAPFLISQGGLWILGAYRPHEEVAIFAAVARFVALVGMPLVVVNAVVAPIIAEMYAQGRRQELEYYLRRTATIAGWTAFAVLLLLVVFGASVLDMVYGEYYRKGYTVLVILCAGTAVNVWSGSCGQTLMMTGGQKVIMRISIVSGLLMITCALLVVNEYGLTAVAAVASAATAMQYVMFVLYARKHTGMWTHMQMVVPTLRGILKK